MQAEKQASLSTYLQKEWLTQYSDTGLSAKDLLKVYTDYFEPEDKKVNGESPKAGGPGGRGSRGRGNRGGRTRWFTGKLKPLVAWGAFREEVYPSADEITPRGQPTTNLKKKYIL